ncbi:hypothetical protein GLW08_02155 [Pontibacillus yanchengensis]|uniref:Uncharacterized protein n=2 Tax=Pontibacillus yanchengensis TaxID=462910 RepID=A0ACC7VB50_9BACI|nr:hypothetical protein [Pontibacillus yanchengensis]MYL52136.1 hypothetical protein [Pontibacillus yanchengensis]
MKIDGVGLAGATLDLKKLDHLMDKAGFVRAGQWDYERVTYDYKLETATKGQTYYIRAQGHALEGDVDKGDAVITLMTPLIGLHYYPHGVEYGDGEEFPPSVVERANKLLERVKGLIDEFNGGRPPQAVLGELMEWAKENNDEALISKIKSLETYEKESSNSNE